MKREMIDTRAAAEYLGVAVHTLENGRHRGGGPPFYRVGRKVVYDARELDGWLSERRHTSTSAAPQTHAV